VAEAVGCVVVELALGGYSQHARQTSAMLRDSSIDIEMFEQAFAHSRIGSLVCGCGDSSARFTISRAMPEKIIWWMGYKPYQ
jgi:hypothetical protein